MLVPKQIFVVDAVIATAGVNVVPMVIDTVSLLIQPPLLVTTKKYWVLTAGVTTGSAAFEVNPAGFEVQLYVLPATAGVPIFVGEPLQIV